ncbi:MAG: VOC family protein [Nocardiaceae bacterium]|nr:VOC family protein [Nocardiaceae bacterium]
MGHSIVHWEIGGPDGAVLKKFYSEAFGWTVTPVDTNYALVDTGGGLAGGIMQTQPGMPSYVTVYIEVADLPAKLAEVEGLGGRTVLPPTAIGESMSIALFTDPGGAVVGLLQTAAG